MFFKNLKVFRLAPNWKLPADELNKSLAKRAFAPAASQEAQTSGWAKPCEHSTHEYVHVVGRNYLITLCTEKKLLPASVVTQFAQARAIDLEEQQGYKPGRRQMKELKEQLTMELLPRAFSLQSTTRAWIDTENRWFVIETTASAKVDELLGILAKCLEQFPIQPLHVEQSPAASMTNWLLTDEPPAGFSIDQTTELQSTGNSRASVRYTHQNVDIEDVRKHVQAGKQCVRLALTWSDRISFTLTENLDIKGVTPLDVLKENQDGQASNDAEQFDADVALMAGELSRVLTELTEALGGERNEA